MATKNCGHKLYITTAKKERLGLIVNHFLSTNHPPITTNQREKQFWRPGLLNGTKCSSWNCPLPLGMVSPVQELAKMQSSTGLIFRCQGGWMVWIARFAGVWGGRTKCSSWNCPLLLSLVSPVQEVAKMQSNTGLIFWCQGVKVSQGGWLVRIARLARVCGG